MGIFGAGGFFLNAETIIAIPAIKVKIDIISACHPSTLTRPHMPNLLDFIVTTETIIQNNPAKNLFQLIICVILNTRQLLTACPLFWRSLVITIW